MFVHDEGGFPGFEGGQPTEGIGAGNQLAGMVPEGVEDGQLPRGMKERLMVVRAVHVHEPFAESGQGLEERGRAVHVLAVGAGNGEGPFQEQGLRVAGFEAVRFENGSEAGVGGRFKDGLDGAGIRAAADEGTVGAVAEDEVEGADEDGLAGAGFPSDCD
jgi:hypothetical protein